MKQAKSLKTRSGGFESQKTYFSIFNCKASSANYKTEAISDEVALQCDDKRTSNVCAIQGRALSLLRG